MSQTSIASPQVFSPAYNPLKFIVDSTNKNKNGFKYIFDIYESGTSNKIAEYKVLPRPIDGYGRQDISKLLQTKVSWDLDTLTTSFYAAPNSYYKYDVKTGEEFVAEFNYTSSLTNSSGNVRINVTNTFQIGDQVIIIQADGGVANPQLEGLHTVIGATGSAFSVNVAWSTITNAAIDGSVRYADNRKVITRDITEFNNRMVFNGAFRWDDWTSYDYNDYKLNAATKLWLTNQPENNFYCTIGQDLSLNIQNPKGTDRIIFENSNGLAFYKAISSTDDIVQVPVGPNNYGTLVGTGDLIDDSVEWYEFFFANGATLPQQDSVRYRVYLDRRTKSVEYSLLFLDRLGSWSSFAFQLKSYERGDVTREVYNQDVQGYVNASDEWTYKTEEFGFRSININVIKSLDLNTNWMTQEMSNYFEELVTSPQVFIKETSYICGEQLTAASSTYQPCIVNNNAYEVFKQRNKNLIRQNINVRFANQDNING
jgi:hypothetical protein